MKALFLPNPLPGVRILYIFFLFLIFAAALAPTSGAEDHTGRTGKGPMPAAVAPDTDGTMRINPQDRCPVCAMVPNKAEKFASAAELVNGAAFYFCGTGCLIRSWMHPEVFLGVKKEALKRSVVRDYFRGEYLDGEKVFWVAGSDVIGPMGPAIVPLKTEKDVSSFKKRHNGKVTFKLSEMNDELWKNITGKNMVRK